MGRIAGPDNDIAVQRWAREGEGAKQPTRSSGCNGGLDGMSTVPVLAADDTPQPPTFLRTRQPPAMAPIVEPFTKLIAICASPIWLTIPCSAAGRSTVGCATMPYGPRRELNRRKSSTDASTSDLRMETLSTLMPIGKRFSRA